MSLRTYLMRPNVPPKGWKETFGLFAWSDDNETLYIHPSAISMSPTEAMMCCAHDGEGVVQVKGTVLIKESWARKERPDLDQQGAFDVIRKAAEDIRDNPDTYSKS